MKISDIAIDYELLDFFDKKALNEKFILPFKKEGIYLECFICEDSKINFLDENLLVTSYSLSKTQILFFLSDFEFRKKLFLFSKKILQLNDSKTNYTKELIFNIIKKAVSTRTSDIHIESLEKTLCIRFRIDGTLKIFYVFDKAISKVISSYIKMLSKLDITNSRTPMDGRFSLEISDNKYDFRVSSMPTITGESIVIRVLDNQNVLKSISSLGFSNHILSSIKEITKLTQGLVLVTGPTGSGKSTTLYSLIKSLNTEDKKLITVEDPVEYNLEGIQQIEVNKDIGLGFDTVLRNILRQDPDVILIGEIRDKISLALALQASLTGHLVLASIHANNSAETIDRLLDLQADKFLLSSSLKYILSQRLVLTICNKCNNKGCERCNFTGFYGRSCLAEVLNINKDLASRILQNDSIKEYLEKIEFKSIFDDGLEKVKNKLTTKEEVYKVVEKI